MLLPYHFYFLFSVFCLFLFNKFSRNLHHCRYGRVQSVKIISPGTATVQSSQLNANIAPGDHHHLSSTHSTSINKCSLHQQQPTAISATVGSGSLLEPSIGVNSCSVSNNNNVTSSNHNCITMCAATIAFMDIKSASKAHLAEHKFDDRILTTEYYEPSTMHHGSSEGGLVINSKMCGGDGALNNAVGDMKDSLSHGRFASTSSHGLVIRILFYHTLKSTTSMMVTTMISSG